MANRDIINTLLKQELLDNIFPDVFRVYNAKLKRHNAYMVVIGGVSVEMCARLDENAQRFLKNVFSEDVDIKIVIDDHDADRNAVHNLRKDFVSMVIKKLRKFVKHHQRDWDKSINVQIVLDESLLNHKIAAVRNARVSSIAVEYIETKFRVKYPLVDTTFFSKESTAHFDVYRRIANSTHPVPFYVKNYVHYATCHYMMYDTCRMLIDRANYLREKKTLFALMKFTKYVIKFMSLYVLRKKIAELPKELMYIYDEAHATLRQINTFKLKKGFRKMTDVKYDDVYVDNVVSKLDTILKSSDMKQLIRAINKLPTMA